MKNKFALVNVLNIFQSARMKN